jgi:hypothetical protein
MDKKEIFDKIEVNFKVLRREKIEPELDIDIVIFKNDKSYPISTFDKGTLTVSERVKLKSIEDEREVILNKFAKSLKKDRDIWVNFIENVEETIYLFHRTIGGFSITHEEFEDFALKDFERKCVVYNFRTAFKCLYENAKISGKVEE